MRHASRLILDEYPIHVLPRWPLTIPVLHLPRRLPFQPILHLLFDHRRHPHPLARIRLGRRREPPRLVLRRLPVLPRPPRRPLEVLLLHLEVVRMLVPAQLERALVWPKPAVRRADIMLQRVLGAVVERDRERREVERRGRLDRVAPEENELVRRRRRAGPVHRHVGVQLADPGADLASHKLTVPATRDLVGDVSVRILDVAADLVRVLATPAARLKGQNALISSPVIRNLKDASAQFQERRQKLYIQSCRHNGRWWENQG